MGRSASIQYARAVAALCVVLYHAAVYLERVRGFPELHAFAGGRLGNYGVMTFFVISGYLMADLIRRYPPETFLVHRLIRIYPIYWLCVVLAAAYYTLVWLLSLPDAGHVPAIHHMLVRDGLLPDALRLLLVPIQFPDFPLGIEWTLLYETTFYMLVFLVSLAGLQRWLVALAGVWLVLIIGATAMYPASQIGYTQPTLATLPFFQINAGFIFGIFVHALASRKITWPAAYLGLACMLASELVSGRWQVISISLGLALLVLGLLQREWQADGPRGPWRSITLLGDWSYALYLVHVPVILGVMKLARPDIGPYALFAASVGAAFVAAALVGVCDVRLYAALKRRVDRAGGPARRALVWSYVVAFAGVGIWGVARM